MGLYCCWPVSHISSSPGPSLAFMDRVQLWQRLLDATGRAKSHRYLCGCNSARLCETMDCRHVLCHGCDHVADTGPTDRKGNGTTIEITESFSGLVSACSFPHKSRGITEREFALCCSQILSKRQLRRLFSGSYLFQVGVSRSSQSSSSLGASVATTRLRSAGVRPKRERRLPNCPLSVAVMVPIRNFVIAQTMISTAQRSAKVVTPSGTMRANSDQIFLCSAFMCLGTAVSIRRRTN